MDKDGGRPPTDEELRELGIDPDENRDKRENPRPLPDVLTTGEELCRRHAASLEQLDRMFNRPTSWKTLHRNR